jgi:cytochrome P450
MKLNPALTKQELICTCLDFIEAGAETVGSSLSWIMLYLALYPDIQERCYQEIREHLGKCYKVLQ